MAINHVTLSGNVTRDADLKRTQGGTPVLTFSVATNERRKNASGEWEDHVGFFDCAVFGSRAEKLQPYITKGLKVAVDGKLNYRSWSATDGTRRTRIDVMVDNIEFMSRADDRKQVAQSTTDELFDEDIPF